MLPLWLCAAGVVSGVPLIVAATMAGGSPTAGGGGQPHADHLLHAIAIVGLTLFMMSPLAYPLLRNVADTTMRNKAVPAVVAAWAGFIGLWCVAAVAMHVTGELLAFALSPTGAIALLTVITVVAQLSPRRAAHLSACALSRPVASGSAVGGGMKCGVIGCFRCITVCASPMTLMALSPGLAAALVVAVLLWCERFGERRMELRLALLLGYLVLAACMLFAVGRPII
jgi:hypothetical protein